MRRDVNWFLLMLAVCWAVCCVSARAQSGSQGSVVVTVLDPSGDVVPAAHLELVDVGTNDVRRADTKDKGTYSFVNLNIGTYKLTVAKDGFATQVFTSIAVHAAQTTDVSVPLRVGQANQTVNVTETATPVVETTSNAIGTVIDIKQIEDLPVSNRDLTALSQLTAGYNGTWNGLPANDQGNNIDGVIGSSSRMKFGGNSTPAVTPRLEDIAEMTVQTDMLDLNQGFGQASMQINFVTRRGTNQFHGRVFGDFQNSGLNANSWTDNASGVRKDKLIKNSFGGSLGGPVFKDRLFFFGSFAVTKEPGTTTATNQAFTSAAQSGNFTYTGTDGASHSVNLLSLAGQTNSSLPTTVNSVTAAQFQTINSALTSGSVSGTSDPNYNNVRWNSPSPTTYYYPTVRVDYDLTQKLRMFLAWNMTKQEQPTVTAATFPGSDFKNQIAGNQTKNYSASYGIDWILSPALINQFKAGYLYNATKYAYNSAPLYATEPTVYWGFNNFGANTANNMSGQTYQLPITTYYPILTLSDTATWQHKAHTFNFGFSWYREQDHYWNAPAGFPNYNLGLTTGDPALQAFSSSTLPDSSSKSQQEAQQLYAILTGRIGYPNYLGSQSSVSGQFAYNAKTGAYNTGIGAYNLNELSKAWGVFFQDSWHITPTFTLNYGLRWDFTGDNHDLTSAYHSASPSAIYGPSGVGNLFNPGSLNGDMNPQLVARSHAYDPWNVSPQPALGFAWNPHIANSVFGDDKTVIRGGFALRRFTEPYQYFWDNASDYGAFFYQNFYLNANNTGQAGTFSPGTLSLGNALPAYGLSPVTYEQSAAESEFTFLNTVGVVGIDPKIKQPYSQSWNLGIQRQLGNSRALEIRYNGNRTVHQWIAVNPNEVNIFENGFLDEFKKAQQNLALNGGTSFANNGAGGQQALPIFDAAFAGEASGGPGIPMVDYANSQFINYLQTGQAGAMAQILSGINGTVPYFCNLVGASFSPCATNAGYTGGGAGYPINFFQANPFAAGSSSSYMTAAGYSTYHALQLDFRQNAWNGLQFNANYTWSHTLGLSTTNDWTSAFPSYTLRNLRRGYGPTIYDLHHVVHFSGTYDLPFGAGRRFLNSGSIADKMLGNWTVGTILTLQSGAPTRLLGANYTYNDYGDGGIRLNGITASRLQSAVGVHRVNGAAYVNLIDPKYLASTSGGANTNYITPNTEPGTIGDVVYLHGPHTFADDVSLTKAFPIREGVNFKFQAEFLNAWNHPIFGNTYGNQSWSQNSLVDGNVQATDFGLGGEISQPRRIELRVNIDF